MCYFFWSNTPTTDNLILFLFLSLECEDLYFSHCPQMRILWRALVVCMTQHENCESQRGSAGNAIYFDYVLFIQRCTTHLLCESSNLSQFSIHWIRFVSLRTHNSVPLLSLRNSWHRIGALSRFAMQTCLLCSCSNEPNSRLSMQFCKSLPKLNALFSAHPHYHIMGRWLQGKPDLSAHIR